MVVVGVCVGGVVLGTMHCAFLERSVCSCVIGLDRNCRRTVASMHLRRSLNGYFTIDTALTRPRHRIGILSTMLRHQIAPDRL